MPRDSMVGLHQFFLNRFVGRGIPALSQFFGAHRSKSFVACLIAGLVQGSFDGSLTSGQCTEVQKLTASDTVANVHSFGAALAMDGDLAVVGAPYFGNSARLSSTVYVFLRNGDQWTEQAKLTVSDARANLSFAEAVAVNGDTIVVGAGSECGPVPNVCWGSVYVFRRHGNLWSEEQKLTASDAVMNDSFGDSVAVDGDTIVVGAPHAYTPNCFLFDPDARCGAAYVFRHDGVSWVEEQKLIAADPGLGDEFGTSVAIDGDTIVVGAPYADSGAAYVFVHSGGAWTQQAKLEIPGPSALSTLFGETVSVDGDTVVVARGAYIFDRALGVWTRRSELIGSDSQEGDGFGITATLDGNTVVVGAPGHVVHAPFDQFYGGSVYVFERVGAAYTERAELIGTVSHGGFGSRMAVDDNSILVWGLATPLDDGSGSTSGAVYVYRCSRGDNDVDDNGDEPDGQIGPDAGADDANDAVDDSPNGEQPAIPNCGNAILGAMLTSLAGLLALRRTAK